MKSNFLENDVEWPHLVDIFEDMIIKLEVGRNQK